MNTPNTCTNQIKQTQSATSFSKHPNTNQYTNTNTKTNKQQHLKQNNVNTHIEDKQSTHKSKLDSNKQTQHTTKHTKYHKSQRTQTNNNNNTQLNTAKQKHRIIIITIYNTKQIKNKTIKYAKHTNQEQHITNNNKIRKQHPNIIY